MRGCWTREAAREGTLCYRVICISCLLGFWEHWDGLQQRHGEGCGLLQESALLEGGTLGKGLTATQKLGKAPELEWRDKVWWHELHRRRG